MQLTTQNWRKILRQYSSVALAALTAFPSIWAASPEFQAILPAKWVITISTIIAILGFIGKFIHQKSQDDADKNP